MAHLASRDEPSIRRIRAVGERLEFQWLIEQGCQCLPAFPGEVALRDGVWLTASDSASWDGRPFDAESADEAVPVAVVVGEAVSVAADLLGENVDVRDASVRGLAGGVVGEDLGASVRDRSMVRASRASSGSRRRRSVEEHDQPAACVGDIAGVEHVENPGDAFIGQPRQASASRVRGSRQRRLRCCAQRRSHTGRSRRIKHGRTRPNATTEVGSASETLSGG